MDRSHHKGRIFFDIADWRGTGSGQQLYDTLISDLKNKGAAYLYSDDRSDDAEQHGSG